VHGLVGIPVQHDEPVGIHRKMFILENHLVLSTIDPRSQPAEA
jgi:hypothetical protein